VTDGAVETSENDLTTENNIYLIKVGKKDDSTLTTKTVIDLKNNENTNTMTTKKILNSLQAITQPKNSSLIENLKNGSKTDITSTKKAPVLKETLTEGDNSTFDWSTIINNDSDKTIYESFYELLDNPIK